MKKWFQIMVLGLCTLLMTPVVGFTASPMATDTGQGQMEVKKPEVNKPEVKKHCAKKHSAKKPCTKKPCCAKKDHGATSEAGNAK